LPKSPKDNSHPLSIEELGRIVARHLPEWFRACAAKPDAIVLHEAAFGTSKSELFLFACAIKYAANVGKTVHVTAGRAESSGSSVLQVPKRAIQATYRDRPGSHSTRRPRKTSRKQ
jgi:hypothetical protein